MKLMDLTEFINIGYLQEVNRQFFHPLGLALVISIDNGAATLLGIYTTDDEDGIIFDNVDADKVARVAEVLKRKSKLRKEELGYVIQPIGVEE